MMRFKTFVEITKDITDPDEQIAVAMALNEKLRLQRTLLESSQKKPKPLTDKAKEG
jgi:hypothetical protein